MRDGSHPSGLMWRSTVVGLLTKGNLKIGQLNFAYDEEGSVQSVSMHITEDIREDGAVLSPFSQLVPITDLLTQGERTQLNRLLKRIRALRGYF